MALAKERTVQDSHIGLLQSCSIYNNVHGELVDPSPVGFFAAENQKLVEEEGECSEKIGGFKFSSSFNCFQDQYGLNGGGFTFQTSNSDLDHWVYSSGSILNFEQGGARFPQSIWDESVGKNGRLGEDRNCLETDSGCTSLDNKHGEEKLKRLDSSSRVGDCLLSFGEEFECNFVNKRPYMDDENAKVQVPKKHCIAVPRKPKPKPHTSKDPQSIAAKNRRERISQRLRTLQDLVPNGTKVDLVTMLEKAISYVKFLQLQVKVLATDEFWPIQGGGKAPEITQVKEAMDAILSSYKRN